MRPNPFRPTSLVRQLAAAGLMASVLCVTSVPAQAQTNPATAPVWIVTDGNPTQADDLIVPLQLNPGERLHDIHLDDSAHSLRERFIATPGTDGRLTLRLAPAIDFDQLLGTPATLRITVASPEGQRDIRVPLVIAPAQWLTETLELRQAVPDDAQSYTPRLPLRQAGNAHLLALVEGQVAWPHRLIEPVATLQAEGEQAYPLPDPGRRLSVVRELTPGWQRLVQPLTLRPIFLAALAADLDLAPDADSAGVRFTVTGAWNVDTGALRLARAPDADLSTRLSIDRLDNGDLRLTPRNDQALNDLGYPAAPVQLTLERRFAGQLVLQNIRLIDPAANVKPPTDNPSYIRYEILPAATPAEPLTVQPVASASAPSSTILLPTAGKDNAPTLSTASASAPSTSTQSVPALKAARTLVGDITQYEYDALGNRTRITDPLARSTTAWDGLSRPRTLTQPAPDATSSTPITRLTYDGRDQLAGVTDARNLATAYSVDGLGRITGLSSPDTGLSESIYDAAGNLTRFTDARGQVQTRSYDAANRLTTMVYTGASGGQLARVELAYDQGANGKGRLTGVTERNLAGTVLLSTTTTYDTQGRRLTETRSIPGTTASTQSSTWTAGGHLATQTLPSGRLLAYTWSDGRLIAIATTAPGGTAQTVVSNVTYHPFGGLKSYTLGNGQVVTRNIDTRGRLQSYTLGSATRTVNYDAADRITGMTDSLDATRSATYRYDNLDRLTGSTQNTQVRGYGYDATGNRLTRLVGGLTDQSVVDPASNRIQSLTPAGGTARSYQYDAAGNLLADGVRTLNYDARGRLAQAILGAAQSAYQIDAFGRRVRKNIGTAQEIVFHYDSAGHLIAESKPDGSVLRETFYLHDTPVAVLVGAAP